MGPGAEEMPGNLLRKQIIGPYAGSLELESRGGGLLISISQAPPSLRGV